MRVALVSPYPPRMSPPRGGVQGAVFRLVQFLADAGVECHVVAVDSAEDGIETELNGVTVHRVRASRLPGAIRFWTSTAAKVKQVVKSIGPDICHVHGAAIWASGLDCAAILTIHGATEREITLRHPTAGRVIEPVIRTIEERALRHVGNVILVNPYVREFRRIHSAQRIWEIPNAIDDEYFLPSTVNGASHDSDPMRLLWIGNSSRLKNLRLMVEVVAELVSRGKEVAVDIVGTELSNRERYLRDTFVLAQRLKVRDRLVTHGQLHPRAVRALMDRSTALVLTSLQENAPTVVAESLARGLFVVAPRAFGLPYMIPHPSIGLLYPRQAGADAISDAIERLTAQQLRHGKRNRTELGARHRLAEVGRATLAAYTAVLTA